MTAQHPKEKMKFLVEKINRLPTIPATLSRILEIIEDPKSGAKDLEAVLVYDPAITAKVVAIANSPYYGFKHKVVELAHAVSLIGFDVVKHISIGLSLFSCFENPYSPLSSRINDIYVHSFASGFAADHLARLSPACDRQPAFLCGLLHDIGKLVLIKLLDLNYNNILEIAQDKKTQVSAVEREVLGLDHADVGAWLIDQWGFPEVFVASIRDHHTGDGHPMGQLLSVASALSREMGYGEAYNPSLPAFGTRTLETLLLTDEHVQQTLERIDGARATIMKMM
jgi:putative nucleotidyltransferase with HDIG domain